MSPLLIIFCIIGAVSLIGAFGVVASRNVVHAALFLLLSLLAVAGLYFILYAPFLALVQILIYGGAIIIVIFFALMLTRARDLPLVSLDNPQKPLAIVAGIIAFAVMVFTVYVTKWPGLKPITAEPVGYRAIGESLFTKWAVPFEVASLVLLVALIGAIIIARAGGEK